MELTKEQIKNMQEGLSNPVPWDSYVYATAVSNLLGTIAARDAEIAKELEARSHVLSANEKLRMELAALRGRMEHPAVDEEASKYSRKDLETYYRWTCESLKSFRDKFGVESNCQALDAIDALKSESATLRGRMEALDKAICDLPRQKRSSDDPYGLVEVDKVLLLVRAAFDAPSETGKPASKSRYEKECEESGGGCS